mgnify:CR=1 FL=1
MTVATAKRIGGLACGLRTFFPQQRGGWIRKDFPQRIQGPRSRGRIHWQHTSRCSIKLQFFFMAAPTTAPTRSIKPLNSVNKKTIPNPISVASMLRRTLLLYAWFPIVNQSTKLPLPAGQP